MKKVEYIAIQDIPIIKVGDDIGNIIINKCNDNNIIIENDDIIVIAQKVISIAENAIVNLNNIECSKEAFSIAEKTGRSPEECQVYINESKEIIEIK